MIVGVKNIQRNLKEILSSCCLLCETKLQNLRRSSLWSMLSVDKRKSFSSVTVTSRVHPSVEHSENKIEDNPRLSQAES